MKISFGIGLGLLCAAGGGAVWAGATAAPAEVTFHKDVEPIMQSHCQECHRPGEIGPMSFLSYETTRPWAKAIKAAVLTRKMPPWPADPHYGHFANARSLSDADIATIVSWADNGAPAGSLTDAPPAKHWVEGWTNGTPDSVISLAKPYAVPKTGVVEYTYMIVPTHFEHDTWVRGAEIVPTDRSVVHHIIAFIRPPGSKWFADQKTGEFFVPAKSGRGGEARAELLVGYAPGLPAAILPDGVAKLVPAGSDLVLQLHYTPNGKEVQDQSKVGLYFSEKPREREMTLSATNAAFAIPPQDPNYEVESHFVLQHDVRLIAVMPHMHLRGKDFKYTLAYPDGRREEILSVPKWDFHWQLYYYLDKPMALAAGTRIECVAHYDNSPNNPDNPDPTKTVRWGDQTFEEMMIGWFDVSFPVDMNPMDIFRPAAKTKASD